MTTASAGFDARGFRDALGCFPTGVTVVTALRASGAFVGVTVSSFNALSLEPPLVLWSLSTASPSLEAFAQASHFAVNILAEEQVDISRRFATSAPHKFARLEVHEGIGGVPLLGGCAAYLECRAYAQHSGGDHVLFIGHVERYACDRTRRPLVFARGRYVATGAEIR
ncbi:MAG: flavin reductase family protein [Burkholderiales bacterium]|nr:flavin reductase family protein [Burkholderiales bacterium]